MSATLLGSQIDIHGGGSDLIYPHHENEIAQAECAFGQSPFCSHWLHNGMLQLDGVKMSKSLGNLVLARTLMQSYEPDHLRLYLLSNHLRASANYVDGALDALEPRFGRLRQAAMAEDAGGVPGDSPLMREFEAAMDNDFDVPGALDVLDAAATRIGAGTAAAGESVAVRAALGVLGFGFAGARGPANGDLNP
jgi:cysteinyl-tRNA synthetase